MGGVLKSVKGLVKGPEKVNPQIANKGYFNIAKEVKPAQEEYANLLANSKTNQQAVSPFQTAALTQMGQAATGQGPSLAEAQLKAAQDRNLAQQMAVIQAGRGGNAALNQRTALQQGAAGGRDLAQQAVIQRLQERDNFLNQANLANANVRADVGQKLNVDLMPKRELQGWEQARVGAVNQAQATNAQAQNQLTGALTGGAASLLGGMASGGTGFFAKPEVAAPAAAASDKNVKKDIKSANKDMRAFLDVLSASGYKYKDTESPNTAEGQRYGVMAQDLEKSKVGKSMVKDTENGKEVDYGQGLGALLASQAALHKRLEKIEKKKK